jgi:hypothetical protein
VIPNVAAHIAAAQLGGKPVELTRASPIQAALNRRAALRALPKLPSDLSWDEYPFASTTQGGLGASVAPVPKIENSYQGGILSLAYGAERINPGDTFFVVVIPQIWTEQGQ